VGGSKVALIEALNATAPKQSPENAKTQPTT
jgi:hypothetical protein